MPDGTTEHELCPVLIASVAGQPVPDPDGGGRRRVGVMANARAASMPGEPHTLSPWCVEQVSQLTDAGLVPGEWLAKRPERAAAVGLDRTVELPVVVPRHRASAWPVPSGLAIASASGTRRRAVPAMPSQGNCGPCSTASSTRRRAGWRSSARHSRRSLRRSRSLVDAGGKRLRPAFVYWGHRATGADHDEAVLRPAAAIELLAHVRAHPRRRHGSVGDPPRPTERVRGARRATSARGDYRRQRLVRDQRGDPRRRPGFRVGRRAVRLVPARA